MLAMKVNEEKEVSYSDDDELVTQFVDWTSEAVVELRQIVDDFAEPGLRGSVEVSRLYDLVHNIKGMGGSFNFNLMTVIGTGLCAYLKAMDDAHSVSKRVLEAHIRAFEVVLENRITGTGGVQGETLKLRLQAIVQEES